MKKELQLLKKNSALSQLEAKNLTASQMKIFNFLLQEAFIIKQQDPSAFTFSIETQKLLKESGVSFNSIQLKKAVEAMMEIKVDTDILDKSLNKGEKGWSVFNLIAGAEFNNGLLTFSFPHQIVNTLIEPKLYALINLRSVGKLKTKAANVIYTLAKDYGNCKNGTPKLTIEHLNILIGVGQYDMRTFISKILKKAVKEVNEKTEIEIDMRVEKYGRKIHAVKFIVIKDDDKEEKEKEKEKKEAAKSKVIEEKATEKVIEEKPQAEPQKSQIKELDDDVKKVIEAIKRLLPNKDDVNRAGYVAAVYKKWEKGDPVTVNNVNKKLKEIEKEERYDRYRSKVGKEFIVNGVYDYKVVSMYYDKENDSYRYIIENIENHSRLDKPADDLYPYL